MQRPSHADARLDRVRVECRIHPDPVRRRNDRKRVREPGPNVVLFDRGYAPPRSIRSNLQWTGAVLDNRVIATLNGVYSRNEHQPGFVDLNLDPTARFSLASEGGRPVFVQPASIVPSTGVIASRDGRVASQFNHVTQLRSDLSSVTRQLQLLLAPAGVSTHYTWGLNYTLNSVRDRANGFVSTVANPFGVERRSFCNGLASSGSVQRRLQSVRRGQAELVRELYLRDCRIRRPSPATSTATDNPQTIARSSSIPRIQLTRSSHPGFARSCPDRPVVCATASSAN